MGPKRKKSKPDGEEVWFGDGIYAPESDAPKEEAESSATQLATSDAQPRRNDAPPRTPTFPSKSAWSWRPKADAVAQLARESISVSQGATTESSECASPRPPPSVSKSMRGSRKSIPLAAEATKVHATSDVNRPRFSSEEKEKVKSDEGKALVVEDAQLPPDPAVRREKAADTAGGQSWFGWWSRPDGYASDNEKRKTKKQKLDAEVEEVASSTPLPGTPIEEPADPVIKIAQDFEGIGGKAEGKAQLGTTADQRLSKGWFGLWSSAQNEQAIAEQQSKSEDATVNPPEITISTAPAAVEDAVKVDEPPIVNTTKETDRAPTSSGWAFWSSDKPKDPAPTPGGTQKQIGELSVADTPSENNPEVAQFNEQREVQKTERKPASSLLRPKRGRPTKIKDAGESSSAASTPAARSPAPSQVSTSSEPPSRSESEPPRKTKPTALQRPNAILPSFRDTFPPAPNPSYIDRLTTYLSQTLNLPGSQPTQPPQHVYIAPSPPIKIRRAVALGVHGFFPAAVFQTILGPPTGTSIRFANYAATAIKTWCAAHQADVKDVEIEKVALEGEGYINDRVATLWKLLLNWLEHLRKADFILVACHSQGVPVAIMLLAKLILLGALSPNVRIGVCAMAGVNLGPFLEYKSRLWGGTALELFDFCSSASTVSKAYTESLKICLKSGVRITYVGSLDDQIVSLESALHAPLTHAYVNRAVFVDGRLPSDPGNFLTHLVVFALKLRNLGVSDHNLLRELSGPLAGSIVLGEGHSRIYDDAAVYALAVEFALESTDVPSSSPPMIASHEPPPTSTGANPFYLPWAVRGMLEEDVVKKDPKLREEVEGLVREFEEWKPSSKVLRDVRWRLEGVRSMY